MRCDLCGTPLDRFGRTHYCRHDRAVPDESARSFTVASRRVVRFGMVYAAMVVIAGVLGLAGYATVSSRVADPTDASTTPSVLVVGAISGQVGLVCVAGLLISTVLWIVSARRLAGRPGVAGYGSLVLCFLLIASAYVLPGRMPTPAGSVATEVAMRVGAVLVLIACVLGVRGRIRRRTGLPAWPASQTDPS